MSKKQESSVENKAVVTATGNTEVKESTEVETATGNTEVKESTESTESVNESAIKTAATLKAQKGVKEIYRTADKQWFTKKEYADAHAKKIGCKVEIY